MDCYRIDAVLRAASPRGTKSAGSFLDALDRELLIRKKPLLVSARIPYSKRHLSRALESHGFKLIEKYDIYKRRTSGYNKPLEPGNGIIIRPFRKSDLPALKKIAGSSFTFDRFHRDARIPSRLADKTREEWIKNSCSDRSHYVLVAERSKRPAGFISVRRDTKVSRDTIKLIAVKKEYRGLGAGTALVLAAVKNAKAGNVKEITVGTQSDNSTSVSMYRKAGFRAGLRMLTYHKHL